MGGFTVNGCGTGDSFYPKLNLGNHFCKICNSIQEFDLMEVKRKVKVLYIPTFSLNTKYAVACNRCKTGYYVDDSIRDELLYGRMSIEVPSGQIIYKKTLADSSKVKNGLTKYCKYCGSEIGSDQIFCFSCGIKAE